MTYSDFIIELFCRIDDQMKDIPKHSQAKMYPRELVTLSVLLALKGGGRVAVGVRLGAKAVPTGAGLCVGGGKLCLLVNHLGLRPRPGLR